MTNDNKPTIESGLPDIAKQESKNKFIIAAMIIAAIAFLGMHLLSKTSQKEDNHVEETYTVATDTPIQEKKPASVQEKVSEANIMSEIKPEELQKELAYMQEKQRELQQRLAAPLMVVNSTQSNNAITQSQTQKRNQDPNMQFMEQVSSQDSQVTNATRMAPLNFMVVEGHLIHAILESATDSDLPGFLRAVVSQPVYAEDGSQILIPQGSRLIGQYKSGMMEGQSRIFIVWTRLIIPGGVSVQLGSAGIDSLGVAGIGADEINRHFWQRFGTASLLSLIGAGAANVGVNGDTQSNSVADYRSAVANSFAQSASQSMQNESMIAPTLKTYQGKPIMVFVAHDLNFQDAMKNTKSKLNVF